jgi:hypothetical protein
MILIQDLLLNDPADRVPLRAVMNYYSHRVPKCGLDDSLEKMFDQFRKGDSHMAFVYTDNARVEEVTTPQLQQTVNATANNTTFSGDLSGGHNITTATGLTDLATTAAAANELQIAEAVGIVTLENIIEALVQSEIMDEADTKREKRRRSKCLRKLQEALLYLLFLLLLLLLLKLKN